MNRGRIRLQLRQIDIRRKLKKISCLSLEKYLLAWAKGKTVNQNNVGLMLFP